MTVPVDWTLRELQTWFLEVTTHPGSLLQGVAAQAQRVPPRQVTRVVRAGACETALERLDIYHRGYFSRLVECLADDYPGVKFAVGEATFEDLCRQYAAAHPSRGPSLNRFGRAFADFVHRFELPSASFVAELAQLEWAIVECLHAPAPDALGALALTQVRAQQLPELRFVASDALRLLSFTHRVNAYLQDFYDEQAPSLPARNCSHVAVVRQAANLWRFDLSDAQNKLLVRLTQSQPLGHALLGIEASATDIQAWFSDWTQHGFFSRVAL
jgi:hypothetical protein